MTVDPEQGADPVLVVEDLDVAIRTRAQPVEVVSGVSFALRRSQTLGLVGESGSGKTMTSLAVMGVLPRVATVTGGSIRLHGQELRGMRPRSIADIRGRTISMVFQDAMRSLNPAFTVGDQIAEVARRHLRLSKREAWKRAVEMLDRVAIREPHRRAHDYPSEFSGGMAQRVMIAMALVAGPDVLIADEPTTALDVTVQAQVLLLLRTLQEEMGLAILFVTHDLGVVAEMCDEVSVMYAGQIVERGSVASVFEAPQHPYTSALLTSLPSPANRSKPFGYIPGVVPAAVDWPAGCRFGPRCAHEVPDRCCEPPAERRVSLTSRTVRCVRSEELVLPGAQP